MPSHPHRRTDLQDLIGWQALSRWRIVGLCLVFVWFFIGGIAHFAWTDVEMRIVPPYIPWPRGAVLVSGALELFGAVGLLWHRTRRVAGIGLMLLTLAVTPCHVYMLQQPQLFDVPMWALWLRLPVQVGLIWVIWAAIKSDVAHPPPGLSGTQHSAADA